MISISKIAGKIKSRLHKRLPDPKLFFLHIPKCGGTSIDKAIGSNYRKRYFLSNDSVFRLNSAASHKASQVAGLPLGAYREHLLTYHMSLNHLKYITGHFVFSPRVFEEFGTQWRFVTILRDPVSRWFSHYFFNRYKKSDHFQIQDDIETYINSDKGIRQGHFLVYYLTGQGVDSTFVSQEVVDQAIENLEKFSLIGCLEHLDIFARNFEKRFALKLNIPVANTNPLSKSEQGYKITDGLRKRVEEICQPDIELYKHALSSLSEMREVGLNNTGKVA
jgi:hypothetical protein